MRKSGIKNYKSFALEVLKEVPDRPVSFEVFADDLAGMHAQAKVIDSWGPNVNVKIPVTNSKGESTESIVRELSAAGVKLNITAVFTIEQVKIIAKQLTYETPAIVSVFAGRIADTGVDPVPIMQESIEIFKNLPKVELLWASPREFLNVIQANEIGCHIITATPDLIAKFKLLNKDLNEFSRETVKMFYNDAKTAGYTIKIT
jgi:transaldolase